MSNSMTSRHGAWLCVLGLCLALREEYEGAEQCVRQAIGLEPDNPDYHIAGAWLSLRQRQWDLAVRRADLALEIGPGNRPLRKACREIRRIAWVERQKEKVTRFAPIAACLEKCRRLKKIVQ